MNEIITKRKSIKNLASLLNASLVSQTTSKRFENMNKEKRVINTNFLASAGTFVDFRLESKNTDFAHFRIITDKQDEISFIINEGPKVGFRTFGSPHSSVKISEKNYFLSFGRLSSSNSMI